MIKEIQAKTILRKHKKIDSWFLSRYGMNIYRGCMHNCAYCDGRAEGYFVEGEFGRDVEIKINAIDVLKKELDPSRKRNPVVPGFAVLGGGVCDAYQPVEKKYQLTRQALELIKQHNFPVHMLTKSVLIERDMDLISEINSRSRAIVSFSFSSCNDYISRIFEPGVPSATERLDAIKKFKDKGISCGMFLMPAIPYITDTEEFLEESVCKAREAGVDFIIFSGMTLKAGRQKDYFYKTLNSYKSELVEDYEKIYIPSKWGNAAEEYYHGISNIFYKMAAKYKVPVRIPLKLFYDAVSENDLVVIILEHMDYILKLKGEKSPYGYAAYSVSQLKNPVSEIRNSLTELKGIGKYTEKLIIEILDRKTCSLYEKLFL
jgi:DNA repair photolyase